MIAKHQKCVSSARLPLPTSLLDIPSISTRDSSPRSCCDLIVLIGEAGGLRAAAAVVCVCVCACVCCVLSSVSVGELQIRRLRLAVPLNTAEIQEKSKFTGS